MNEETSLSGTGDTIGDKIVELSLPSKLGYERVAMDAATSLANRMGFDADRVESLKTAVSEAVTNAIEHGNQHDEAMKVVVVLTARKGELNIEIIDAGKKVLDSGSLLEDPVIEKKYLPGDDIDRGGWGIWLIRELMDEVEIKTTPCGGNQVRMVIHLEK
jgi:serine/threonine-protein kinase RsbW